MNFRDEILKTANYGILNEAKKHLTADIIDLIKSGEFVKAAEEYVKEISRDENIDKTEALKNAVATLGSTTTNSKALGFTGGQAYKFSKELNYMKNELLAKEVKTKKEADKEADKAAGKKVTRKYKKATRIEKIDGRDVEVEIGHGQKGVKKTTLDALHKVGAELSFFIKKLETSSDSEIKRIANKVLDAFPKGNDFKEDKNIIKEFIKTGENKENIKKVLISHLKNNKEALETLGQVSSTKRPDKKDTKEKQKIMAKEKLAVGKAKKVENEEEKKERLNIEKYGEIDRDDPLQKPDTELSKEEIAKGLEIAKKYAGRSAEKGMLGENRNWNKEYMLRESYNYRGSHFWENYTLSLLVKGFNEDVKAFGLKEATEMYIDFYGEETAPIFEYMEENSNLVEIISNDKGLLFEGYFDKKVLNEVVLSTGVGGATSVFAKSFARNPKTSFLQMTGKELPGFFKGLWQKFIMWGGKITKGISEFASKGYFWARDVLKQGFQWFNANPLSMTVVPALAITGSVVAAIALINKARKKGKLKKMNSREVATFKEIAQRQQKTIEKLRGDEAAATT